MLKTKQISLQTILSLMVIAGMHFSSCKKFEPYEGVFELTGTVRDELTGKPIQFAEVELIQSDNAMFSSGTSILLEELITQSNGEFKFLFHADESEFKYEIRAREQMKYEVTFNFPRVELNHRGKSRQDVTLMPKGYLTLHIKGNKGGPIINIAYNSFRQGVDTLITIYREPLKKARINYFVYDLMYLSNDTPYGNLIHRDSIVTIIPLPPDTAFHLIEF